MDPLSGKTKSKFKGKVNIIDATRTQLNSYESGQLSGWDTQSSRLLWRHKIASLNFVYDHYVVAQRSGKILVINLYDGKIKARIKPSDQLRQFYIYGRYLTIGDKLYEPI